MKIQFYKTIFILLFFGIIQTAVLQEQDFSSAEISENQKNTATFKMGNGIDLNLNDGEHRFIIGGMVQPRILFEKVNNSPKDLYLGIKNAFMSFSGEMYDKKISFLVQANFSDSYPLLDAWMGWNIHKNVKLSVGQKLAFTNNREMNFQEYNLQFASRSELSNLYSKTGREFGLFLESGFSIFGMGLSPKISVTTGDGKNSFGLLSNDVDNGGLKYGGRIDFYPFGFFKGDNDCIGSDVNREEKIKVVIGYASAYNVGASNNVGEGHYKEDILVQDNFTLYTDQGEDFLPNYLQNYVDIMLKYKGFTLLGEYVNSAAYNLDGSYIDAFGTLLVPTQISEYLILGNSYNLQSGYLFKGGFSLDFRYGQTFPEFENENSLLQPLDVMGIGITQYLNSNQAKIQLLVNYLNYPENNSNNIISGELLFQIKF